MIELAAQAITVGDVLKERGDTVATSESSTGGLISAALLSIPGASAYFTGGVVVYTGTARTAFLGIDLDDHPDMRSATEEYALLTARTVRERLGTTWGLAETGAAGPTGNRYGDNAGHTCIAIAGPREHVETLETGLADRGANMQRFAQRALEVFALVLGS